MNQTSTGVEQQKSGPSGARVDMKLEVHVIPVSDVERAKQFYHAWVGGSTQIWCPERTFASCSSHLQAQGARSPSAWG
jgi:predicted enzyme related to lactoylglutathione lyase